MYEDSSIDSDNESNSLFDEIFAMTGSYRCQYLQILIQKYVNTQEEIVDIDLRNFTVTKSTSTKSTKYLRRLEEKPFGFVSTYDCKSAKKITKKYKKKVIFHRRASFRKYNDTKSKHSSEEENEGTVINETRLDVDQPTISFDEENERNLLHENSSFLPDKITPEKKHGEIVKKDEAIKLLAYENCNVNLLRPNNLKVVSLLSEKLEDIFIPKNKEISSVVSSPFGICHNKSLLRYISSKGTPKVKLSDIGCGISNENAQVSSFCNRKSLACASDESSELRREEVYMKSSNKSCPSSNDFNVETLSCVIKKSTRIHRLRPRKDGKVASKQIYPISDDSDIETLSCVITTKPAEIRTLRPRGNEIVAASKKNYVTSGDCKTKSLLPSNKSVDIPKLRSMKDRLKSFDENNQNSSGLWDDEKIATSKKSYVTSGDCNTKPLLSSNKSIDTPKLRSMKDRIKSFDENDQNSSGLWDDEKIAASKKSNLTSGDCNTKPLLSSNKSIDTPKLRLMKDGMKSNKNYQNSPGPLEDGKITASKENRRASGYSRTKSLSSNNSIDKCKLSSMKDEIQSSDKTRRNSIHYSAKSLPCSSSKSSEISKLRFHKLHPETSNASLSSSLINNSDLRMPAQNDPLLQRKISKKKPSLSESVLSNLSKSYKSYLEESVGIDDLSLRQVSSSKKASKKK